MFFAAEKNKYIVINWEITNQLIIVIFVLIYNRTVAEINTVIRNQLNNELILVILFLVNDNIVPIVLSSYF